MDRLLDLVRRLMASLVYGGEQGARRLQLRALHARLRGCKPPLFRPRGAALLPGFAERLRALARALEPLRPIFRYTLSHEDPEAAERFADWLVEARLPASLQVRRLAFTYGEMKGRIAPEAALDDALKAIGDQFARYMDSLDGETYADFDAAMEETLRLASLCGFDLEALVRRFAPAVAAAGSGKPAAVPGAEIAEELLDLYFVLAALDVTDQVAANVRALAERLHAGERYDEGEVKAGVGRVREMLSQALPPPLLLDLIRAVRADPAYLPRADRETREHLAAFKRKVTEQYERERTRLAAEVRREALEAEARALFAGAELLDLKGYNDEENELLARGRMDTYDRVFALRILKSFAVACYENRLMDSVKRLLIDGLFRDRDFQQAASAAALSCEGVRPRIEEFEAQFGEAGRFSSRVIHRSLEGHRRGKAAVSVELRRIIRTANKEARVVVEEASGAFARLAPLLAEGLADSRARLPAKIANIRAIGGDHSRAFLASLERGCADIRRLLAIVKQSAVVQLA